MSTLITRAAAALVTLATVTANGQTIVDLGALPDVDPTIPTPPTSSGNGINAHGHVAGGSAISGGSIEREPGVVIAEPFIPHPFRWVDGVIEDLGILGGDVPPDEYPKPQSIAWSINDAGWIVGEIVPVDDFAFHAFVWLPEPAAGLPGGFTELPWIAERARAWSISQNAVVAGESRIAGELGLRAVYWTLEGGRWTVHDLGTFGGPSSAAYGVNDLGQITGFSGYPGGVTTTFLHLPEPAYGLPAGTHDVTPDFNGDVGNDINEHGQIAGRGSPWLPMVWLPEPALGLPAGATVFTADEIVDAADLEEIDAIGIALAEFTAISNDGTAVGWADFAIELPNGNIGFTRHAIARVDGEFSLVQQLLPEGSGWIRTTTAWDVNDAGQITGSGQNPAGDFVGYVLTLPSSCSGDANGDGVVDVVDLVAVISSWGACPDGCAADIDGNGTVDVVDLVAVISGWGACR